ncbi:MAG: type III pantothenate kinase [Deferribacteraceae bacterium]|jgi:type III pantothenate kinase|nr:type III pantothenate kinase [Deferribacteraceae bacterium]
MIFVFDIGNTNIVFGVMEKGELKWQFRLQSDNEKTTDEYAISLLYLTEHYKIKLSDIKAAMVSSVVPQLTYVFTRLIRKYLHIEPTVVNTTCDHGIKIMLDNPSSLGSDRLMGAVAAYTIHRKNCITVDFGTATTIEVLTKAGEFMGGIIFPGVKLSANALHAKTAQLPEVDIAKPRQVVGKNTVECIQSGLYYGYVEMVDGLIDRIKREQFPNEEVMIISTGGLGTLFAAESRHAIYYEPTLIPKGLYIMYQRIHGE